MKIFLVILILKSEFISYLLIIFALNFLSLLLLLFYLLLWLLPRVLACGLEYESLDRNTFKVPSNLHFSQFASDMVLVHVKVVALEWRFVHASIDRVKIPIFKRITMEINHHLVGRDMVRLPDNILPVWSNFETRNIWSIVVASKRHLSMEEELHWSTRPWQIRILHGV